MIKYTRILSAILLAVITGLVSAAPQRDYLIMVGSTTVHPFSVRVADEFSGDSGFKRPMLQATGSGGGLMLFCAGIDVLDPDITYASRRIRKSEFESCGQNGVSEIVELKIGFDGIILAGHANSPPLNLSLRDIFLALAREVPDPGGDETLIANPYRTWKDVNPALPDTEIRVYGPSRGSGTHYIFRRLAMEAGCRTFDRLRELKREDVLQYKTICRTLRGDGAYVEAGEDDAATVQQLVSDPEALAILGYAVLEQNDEGITAATIEGIKPGFDTIADDSYPVSRPLYLYVKKANVDVYPGIREFLGEFTSDRAWGNRGYLTDLGLVPMSAEERRKYAADAKDLAPLLQEALQK